MPRASVPETARPLRSKVARELQWQVVVSASAGSAVLIGGSGFASVEAAVAAGGSTSASGTVFDPAVETPGLPALRAGDIGDTFDSVAVSELWEETAKASSEGATGAASAMPRLFTVTW